MHPAAVRRKVFIFGECLVVVCLRDCELKSRIVGNRTFAGDAAEVECVEFAGGSDWLHIWILGVDTVM